MDFKFDCLSLVNCSAGRLILNVLGRAAVGSGFSAVYLWSNELFPTSVRHSGMGLGSLSARVGSVAAPWARVIADRLPVPVRAILGRTLLRHL